MKDTRFLPIEGHRMRCRFTVELTDGSGTIQATIFGADAEKLFFVSAKDWTNPDQTVGYVSFNSHAMLKSAENRIFHLRPYQHEVTNITKCRFNIHAVHNHCATPPSFLETSLHTSPSPRAKKPRQEVDLSNMDALKSSKSNKMTRDPVNSSKEEALAKRMNQK